jgi:hypothetical protein
MKTKQKNSLLNASKMQKNDNWVGDYFLFPFYFAAIGFSKLQQILSIEEIM